MNLSERADQILERSREKEDELAAWRGRTKTRRGDYAVSQNENYPEPISLGIESLIPMPKEIFTGWFGDMVSACSRATETPIELPALLGLSVLRS